MKPSPRDVGQAHYARHAWVRAVRTMPDGFKSSFFAMWTEGERTAYMRWYHGFWRMWDADCDSSSWTGLDRASPKALERVRTEASVAALLPWHRKRASDQAMDRRAAQTVRGMV